MVFRSAWAEESNLEVTCAAVEWISPKGEEPRRSPISPEGVCHYKKSLQKVTLQKVRLFDSLLLAPRPKPPPAHSRSNP
jgi:hypothetical protein